MIYYWDEEGEGSVKLEIETPGLTAGGLIQLTTIFNDKLDVTIQNVSDGGITSVSDYIVCDENDVITLVGDPGSAYLGDWLLDSNMTCSTCSGSTVKISPKAGFEGYMTATYRVACGLTWYNLDEVSIWVGPPSTPVITLPNDADCLFPGTNPTLFAHAEGAEAYEWSIPNCGTPQTINNLNTDCWFSNDGDNANSQNSVFVGVEGGFVSVWASNECGESSSNLYIEVCDDQTDPGPTGGNTIIKGPRIPFTDEENESEMVLRNLVNNEVSISPNPASDVIQLQITQKSRQNYTYQILSTTGLKLVSGSIDKSNMSIDISELNQGLYIVNIIEEGKLHSSQRIVKN